MTIAHEPIALCRACVGELLAAKQPVIGYDFEPRASWTWDAAPVAKCGSCKREAPAVRCVLPSLLGNVEAA